jgi:hypothetical protein
MWLDRTRLRLAIAGTALATGLQPSELSAVGPGDPAPDFTLQDVNGVSHTLSDYRGRVVLLALVGYG